jgi:hypothetical protein
MQPAGAPKLQTAKTSSLALLARLEPSLRFRFSLIALGRDDKTKMAARLRPAKKLLARDASHGQDTAIRREALPIAENESNMHREATPGARRQNYP